MKEEFEHELIDNGFTSLFKREANIKLASLTDKGKYSYYRELYGDVLPAIRKIGDIDAQADEWIDECLAVINRLWNIGLLSPLELTNDEFHDTDIAGRQVNKRYSYIYKEGSIIYNTNAFNLYIRKMYDNNDLKEYKITPYTNLRNTKLYINKGGIVTGEYIDKTIIPQNIVDKQCFTIQSIINIPCSCIMYEGFNVYTVDHREPKLKALMEFYNVPISFDENIAKLKLNIRKYKKLK